MLREPKGQGHTTELLQWLSPEVLGAPGTEPLLDFQKHSGVSLELSRHLRNAPQRRTSAACNVLGRASSGLCRGWRVSRHHQSPSLQLEHWSASGKEALPLPLGTTALSWALRQGDTNSSESGGFTLSLEEPMPPPGKHCAG